MKYLPFFIDNSFGFDYETDIFVRVSREVSKRQGEKLHKFFTRQISYKRLQNKTLSLFK